ncbi:putative quinol monooxygenase [Thalassomonas haliotis]|uniref:Antibiotic biosynthesis monooxygenase n=1 Tax=Thalassomonas haliotis TaxID=485448 RepID=A0ABY7VIF1_9GAMM|nr:antibiotic biosynthesis monooxygenase family protein [Thalassomonas haliotis]WDE12984.1 antibiotic biosynthesis monooxygenase [Thalassomonas haliotis]
MMSVTRINEFLAAEGKAEELFTFLKSLMSYISSSDGCESCEVLQSNDNEHIFVVIEKWNSEHSHKQSIENYPKEKMAAAMPLIGAPPKGSFYHS